MEIIPKQPAFCDERGTITDILDKIPVDSVVLITCTKGSVRGNHYHKQTTQYTYVLDGKFRAYTQIEGKEVEVATIAKGDLVVTPPEERHAFEAIEDSVLLALCLGPRMGTDYENDTFRLERPLCAAKPIW